MFFFKKKDKQENLENEKGVQEKKKPFFVILARVFVIVFIVLIVIALFLLSYNSFFSHKVFPGVYLNDISMGGKSYSDVYNFLDENSNKFINDGIEYKFNEKSIIIKPIVSIGSDGATRELVSFYNDETAKEIFSIGRRSNFFLNMFEQLKVLLIQPKNIEWKYDFSDETWKDILKESFSEFEKPFTPPHTEFENGEMIIKDSIDGEEFNYDLLVKFTKQKINKFDFSKVILVLNSIKSPVTIDMAKEKIENAKNIIDLKELIFHYKEDDWKINSDIYTNWIVFIIDDANNTKVSFDFDKFKEYFEKHISISINQESKDAKFEIIGGKVSKFQGSQDGYELNLEESFKITEEKINNLENNIDLVVDVKQSDVETKNVNDFGIKEIIGSGESDFKGSPKNRIHNIKTGAAKLNGMLIAPGEEFSTIGNLLPIDAAGGYLTELVIKDNRTIPEYGGGLCQIGTTVYRAAIDSGLKITERRPHSYRVVYYEPAGTDATIYDPWPDLKFVNDTEHYILIQSNIVGTKLYFDFWGTKDGRKVTISKPVIYNIVKPAPTKEVQTDTLAPGVRKCTESAHAGADAYFDYRVEYADDREVYEERVRSHYVPWQAVCLVGVEKKVEEEIPTETTTGDMGDTNTENTATSSQE
ncbi:MAG: VanW family protein [Patescibacteria group bacterium]|nr:VanW family protein [Patescibacteria group bacterium]MDD4304171.1 VanW family protein [Patescibacteria group bacterium]MDD4695203.1 VanW family protein [Patescibacteria group bacterium]